MSFDEDEDLFDEPEEPNEPDEGDWVTEDHATFREYGGRDSFSVDRNATDAEMWRAIDRRMKADNFYPNVWFLSDHGNYHLMERPKPKRR